MYHFLLDSFLQLFLLLYVVDTLSILFPPLMLQLYLLDKLSLILTPQHIPSDNSQAYDSRFKPLIVEILGSHLLLLLRLEGNFFLAHFAFKS